jgi:hypothetical protein
VLPVRRLSTLWPDHAWSVSPPDFVPPAAWPWTFQRFREVMAEPDMDDFDLTG